MEKYSGSGKGHYGDYGEKYGTFEKGYREEIKSFDDGSFYGAECNVHGRGRVIDGVHVNGEINAEANAFTLRADNGAAAKFFSTKAGVMGGATAGFPTSAGYNLNADVAKAGVPLYGDARIDSNLGVDLGSKAGFIEDSVQGKVLGLGGSIGRRVGISTPLGGFSFKLW